MTALADRELRAQVRDSIARMPEAYRTVLLLREIEGMPLGEIGELLNLRIGTVKMRLHRGRESLRRILGPIMRIDTP